MAIAFVNLGASANPDINDNADASSYANTSSTPPTSDLAVAYVASTIGAGTPNDTSISGWGITWTFIVSRAQGQNKINLLGANLSGATAGALTVDFAAQTQTACMLSLFQATGVDLTGGVAAAFVQTVVGGGAAATFLELALAAAGHADNRPIAGFFHRGNEGSTERTNWTEMDDLFGATPVHDLETQSRADAFETTARADWATSAVQCGIAAELKASVVGAAEDPFPYVGGGYYPHEG